MSTGPATRQLRKARKLLQDAQLIAVFRAAQQGTNPPVAAKIVCRALDEGIPLEQFVKGYDATHLHIMHMSLRVTELAVRRFKVEFGFAKGRAGDGGEWDVHFDENGALISIEGGCSWIC